MCEEIYVKYSGQIGGIKLTAKFLMNVMEEDGFINYCERYNLTADRLRSYYTKDSRGKIISPRWVFEYLRDCHKKFETIQEGSKTLTYNHSRSGKKIFEFVGVTTYEYGII